MRGGLARAAANTALRGQEPRTRFARWTARWFARTPTVAASRFQAADEPHPRHWRRFPEPWPTLEPDDPVLQDPLARVLAELPVTWRDVLIARDALGQDVAEVASRLGLTPRQQRAILNRARAAVRARLAELFAPGGDK